MGRRASSSLSLTNGTASPRAEPSGSQSAPQRKRLLKAPSLAELDSSDSDVSMSVFTHLCVWMVWVCDFWKIASGTCRTNNDWVAFIFCIFRMRLLGANLPAAPVWLHLWWMTHPQNLHWGRKVSQELFLHPCYTSVASSTKPYTDSDWLVLILQPHQQDFS